MKCLRQHTTCHWGLFMMKQFMFPAYSVTEGCVLESFYWLSPQPWRVECSGGNVSLPQQTVFVLPWLKRRGGWGLFSYTGFSICFPTSSSWSHSGAGRWCFKAYMEQVLQGIKIRRMIKECHLSRPALLCIIRGASLLCCWARQLNPKKEVCGSTAICWLFHRPTSHHKQHLCPKSKKQRTMTEALVTFVSLEELG